MIISDSQKWLILALLIVAGWLLYLLAPVLTPFFISVLLSYLGDPVVDRLERIGLSRTVSVMIVFVTMLLLGFAAVLIMLPAIQGQFIILIHSLPTAIEWLQQWLLPKISSVLSFGNIAIDVDGIKQELLGHWQEVGSLAKVLMVNIGRSSQLLVGWLTYLLLIPVVTFYLLRDWDTLVANVHDLLPRSVERTVTKLVREIDAVLAEFLRGQLAVMSALGAMYIVGLWLVGLDLAFIVGLLAGFLSFVPYLGVIVGVSVAGLAALVQFHDVIHVGGVVAVFAVGQLLEGMLLSPLLVGDRIGLHPVAVIFAVLAGGQLFGFLGVLLALPVAAVIVVLLRHSKREYQQSGIYASNPSVTEQGPDE